MTRLEGVVCVVPKMQGLVLKCKPCSPGRNVAHLLKGGEWDALLLDYFHANHLMQAMVRLPWNFWGRR
jgi:hypothetical protein